MLGSTGRLVRIACLVAGLGATTATPAAETERNHQEVYEAAVRTQRGALAAGMAGVGLAGVGAALVAGGGGCGDGDVCEGQYIGDPMVLAGMSLGIAGSLTLAANGIRARKALLGANIHVSSMPSAAAWVFGLGAIGTGLASMRLAQPADWFPKMPVVGRWDMVGITGGLLTVAYVLGGVQLRLVTRPHGERPRFEPEPAVVFAPWFDGSARGVAVAGRF